MFPNTLSIHIPHTSRIQLSKYVGVLLAVQPAAPIGTRFVFTWQTDYTLAGSMFPQISFDEPKVVNDYYQTRDWAIASLRQMAQDTANAQQVIQKMPVRQAYNWRISTYTHGWELAYKGVPLFGTINTTQLIPEQMVPWETVQDQIVSRLYATEQSISVALYSLGVWQ